MILLSLAGGCAPEPPPAPRALWDEEAGWARVEHGWAWTVPLAAPRSFPAAGGERFRAVVFPSAGAATLTLRTAKGARELRVTMPRAVDLELRGPEAVLSAEPEVRLLRPRTVARGRRHGRRILLAVADTLRLDHADEANMPELDRYFAGGTRFDRAYSPASWTLPSLASVFTGEPPSRLRSPDGTLISLASGALTLASDLRERGYLTVGVTANYTVNHENGFSAGFDLFFAPRPTAAGLSAGELPDASWVGERALEAAQWLAGEDLFLYLQYMDPHEPYRNHESGRVLNVPPGERDPDARTLADLRAAYASEARHLSRELGSLLARLGDLELAVFTADHGEEFFEHRGFRHGPTLYDEVVRVPLWVRGAGVPERTIRQPFSLVDLKRLILEGPEAVLGPAGGEPVAGIRPVTIETFAHGPPRWSAIVDRARVIYFARDLVPRAAEQPIARWLVEHHPRMSFADLDGRPIGPAGALVRRSIDLLLEHFAGHRRGLFLLFEGGEPALEVSGVVRDGLLWGDAADVAVAEAAPGKLRVEVREPRPFALLFLPSPQGTEEPPRVVLAATGERLPVAPLTAAPRRPRHPGVAAWFDPGRPSAVLRGVEETLERLKALGYLG